MNEARQAWAEAAGELDPAQTDSGIPVEAVYTPLDAGVEDPRYLEQRAMPGAFPFTRGIYPSMYRGRPWTIRLYAGWGTPEDTNERFRYLLDRGQTGLSVALDLPTQMGLDSDEPLARPEVGKVGVAVASLADMETIFEGIPLDRVSTSFTINATAPILLAMYQAVAEKQVLDLSVVQAENGMHVAATRLTDEQLHEAEAAFHSLAGRTRSLTFYLNYALTNYRDPAKDMSVAEVSAVG